MNTDSNPFAGDEPKAAARLADLARDFDLAEAAGGASRTGSVFGGSDQGAAPAAFPPPRPRLGVNSLGPTLGAQSTGSAAATDTRLAEEEEAKHNDSKSRKKPSAGALEESVGRNV